MTDEEIDKMADNFVNAQDFTKVYGVARKAECSAFWKSGLLLDLKRVETQQSTTLDKAKKMISNLLYVYQLKKNELATARVVAEAEQFLRETEE